LAFLTICIGMPVFTSYVSGSDTYRKFDILEYKGCKVMGKIKEGNEDWDWYVLKNNTTAKLVQVPSWFGMVYNIGDSIK